MSQSRSGAYDSIYRKEAVPPQGYYQVNYAQVEKASPNLSIYKHVEVDLRTPLKKEAICKRLNDSDSPCFRRTATLVNFDKMLERPPITSSPSPNEARFISIDLDTPVWSRNKKLMSVSFEKSLSRGSLMKSPTNCELVYNPNKEVVLPSIGRTIPFDKMRSRKALFPLNESLRREVDERQACRSVDK